MINYAEKYYDGEMTLAEAIAESYYMTRYFFETENNAEKKAFYEEIFEELSLLVVNKFMEREGYQFCYSEYKRMEKPE